MYSLYIGINGGEKIPADAGMISFTLLPSPRTAERRYIDGDRCRILSDLAAVMIHMRVTDDAAVDMLLDAGMNGGRVDFLCTVGRFSLNGTGYVLIDRIYASQLTGCEAEIRIVI